MDMFKINVVVELEKETAFANAYQCKKILKEKYELNDRECSEIYIKIVKYQCEKYGANFSGAFGQDKKIERTDNIYKITKRRR